MRLQFFKVISWDTFYMGKAGLESEAGTLYVGSILCAAVANELRHRYQHALPDVARLIEEAEASSNSARARRLVLKAVQSIRLRNRAREEFRCEARVNSVMLPWVQTQDF